MIREPRNSMARRTLRPLVSWGLLLLASVLAWQQLLPRVLPFLPEEWSLTRAEARARAVEILRELGGWPEDAVVVVRLVSDDTLERRLRGIWGEEARSKAPDSLRRRLHSWEITVYPQQAVGQAWSHQAKFALDGTLLQLSRSLLPSEGAGSLTVEEAVEQAATRLADLGITVGGDEPPEVRRSDRENRSDIELRYRERPGLTPLPLSYGLVVRFAGRDFVGFESWLDDPERREVEAQLWPLILLSNLRFFSSFFLLPVLTVLFFRRYHEGEVGVRRALELFTAVLLSNLIVLVFTAFGATEGFIYGSLSRTQLAWTRTSQTLLLYAGPLALVAFFSWAVGESICRERWASKLAAFDALLQGRFQNRTVAVSSLRGISTGWALATLILAFIAALYPLDVQATGSALLGPYWHQGPAIGLLGSFFILSYTLVASLAGRLFLLSWLTARLGQWAGLLLATVLGALLFYAPVATVPWPGSLMIAFLSAFVANFLFLRFDLLTSWLALATAHVALASPALLKASTPSLELHGWLLLLAPALPLFLSLRHLGSEQEFEYHWLDIPAHVKRIADRERQRLELETARSIQTTILPELASSMAGCDVAVDYKPATEVGGDFYAAIPLVDGRLALALGDVAGHGVPAGLIMSMVRAALEIHVEHDPGISRVIQRLNRLVYTSAHRRHLVTLCYGILDPQKRTFEFGCAGQIFPYLLQSGGLVRALESIAYPLGVRTESEVVPRTIQLESGDCLLFASDGAVELRSARTGEPYSFDRMESLLRTAPLGSARELVEFVRQDLERYRGNASREDDLTLLAVKVP